MADKVMLGAVSRCLILFTRYPEPGQTKTRLIPAIGAEKAALLQQKLTERLVGSFRRMLGRGEEISLLISYSGADEETMREWLGDAHYCRQPDGDLGEKMAHGFAAAKMLGSEKMFLVGSDIPGVDEVILQQTFKLLDERDVVIGPSEDGGFYGIGLTDWAVEELLPSLFENVTWSVETVFAIICQRLEEKGYRPKTLPILADIDTPEDLKKMIMMHSLTDNLF